MNVWLSLAVLIQRILVDVPCRVEDGELKKVPEKGPLILVANHINSMEIPVLLSHLHPRPVTGMAKIESWSNPIFHLLYNIYRAVPVRRGEGDLAAMRQSIERLAEGYILGISPEGTRSYTGEMQQGRPGVALLAVKSGAPIQPVGQFGGEHFWENLRRLKRTTYHIRVGTPFGIYLHGERMNRENSQQITDEIMYQLAAILPPQYRGYYAHLENATEDYLHFEPGIKSNLARAAMPA